MGMKACLSAAALVATVLAACADESKPQVEPGGASTRVETPGTVIRTLAGVGLSGEAEDALLTRRVVGYRSGSKVVYEYALVDASGDPLPWFPSSGELTSVEGRDFIASDDMLFTFGKKDAGGLAAGRRVFGRVRPATGELVWSVETEEVFASSDGAAVRIGAHDDASCFDAATGVPTTCRPFDLANSRYAHGDVTVRSGPTGLSLVDPDGSSRWSVTGDGRPVDYDGRRLVVVGASGDIVFLDAVDGRPALRLPTGEGTPFHLCRSVSLLTADRAVLDCGDLQYGTARVMLIAA